jgi:hypothetical protein
MRRILMTLSLMALAGCAAAPSRYGNYAAPDAATSNMMANDATVQLVSMYPPALNRFNLLQATATDAFGTDLLAGLRAKGYAVGEYVAPVDGKAAPAPSSGSSLGYTITVQGTNMYYLTLYVGPQQLSRIYVAENGSAYPAGAWAHKE